MDRITDIFIISLFIVTFVLGAIFGKALNGEIIFAIPTVCEWIPEIVLISICAYILKGFILNWYIIDKQEYILNEFYVDLVNRLLQDMQKGQLKMIRIKKVKRK